MVDLQNMKNLSEKNFPSAVHMKWIMTVLLGYFGLRLLFFAVAISGYLPPDEVTHLGLSQVFKSFFLPANTSETYEYGLVTNISWLYYWLMGKLLWLNVFGLPDLLFLRLLNIPFAFGTIYFAWRLLLLFTTDRLAQVLLVVVMTNTLMFSFLSASVTYDNLTNLLGIMAIYYLFAYFKERAVSLLFISFLCQLAGCLTKLSFLPLALVLVLLWLLREFRELKHLPTTIKNYCQGSGGRCLFLMFALLCALILNLQLYGGNYIQYGQLRPSMYDVLSADIALENRIAARDVILQYFKDGRLDYGQAMRMTRFIPHPGDRADTVFLLQNFLDHKVNGYDVLSPLEYVPTWVKGVAATSFGVMGHFSIPNTGLTIAPIGVLMFLALLGFAVRWRKGNLEGLAVYLTLLFTAYLIILMYVHNYQLYLYYENLSMGLQGRYLFPIIGAFYVWFSYSLTHLFQRQGLRLGLVVVAALIFFLNDFPFFLYHVTPEWFGPYSPF